MPRSSPPEGPEEFDPRPTADESAEEKAAFHLRMRSRGVRDLAVLRAFELVPRRDFVPHRYRDLAMRDLALPIDCGQTLDEPWLIARMIEALDLQREHRVLQIGAGTGYATAILAQLAGEVIGIERYQSLVAGADARLKALGFVNAAVVVGDGLAVPAEAGPFDRILVHATLPAIPERLAKVLVDGGVIVAGRASKEGQVVTRFMRQASEFAETSICPCHGLASLAPGIAATL